MITRTSLVRLLAAITLSIPLVTGQLGAQITTFNDATNDIAPGISTGGGTLDIVKMEVVDTETDVVFTMTVNGNTATTDWGNFMVGIANQKTPGTTAVNGNGWSRPINLIAGATNGVTNGMTHWIGSWVSGSGGSQLWTYGTTSWTGPTALAGFASSAGSQSTITYTVSKESLGVTNGDTIIFDAYSSGGGGSDSAVDALSNPSNSITSWSGPYTSLAPVLTRSYTLANTALNTTQPITFQVDMRAQIGAGLFNPATAGVDVEWGTGFTSFAALTDGDGDGIYTGTHAVSAPSSTPVVYRFTIAPNDIALPLQPETSSRTFTMPNEPTTLPLVFFNNIAGFRDVTFSVDMSGAQSLGAFNPATQTVQVRGPFNNWVGAVMTNTTAATYSATVRISGTTNNQPVTYKYFVAETPQSQAIGYEGGADRTFNLAFNANLNVEPALPLATDTFSTPDFRPVTFSVDMTVLEAAGGFTPGVDSVRVAGSFNGWDTGSTAYQLADPAPADGIYTGTFIVSGATNSSISYKFFNTRPGAPNGGYESGSDRTATLGASGSTATQVLPTVYWNNDSGQTRDVTFRVDMSIQQALGLFDPATGTVQLRSGSFGEGDARALTRDGQTAVFSATFAVPGNQGDTFQYKFWSPGLNFYNVPNNTGFEQINLANQFQNRVITLEANGVAMNLPNVYFSNQLFYINGAPLNAFSTTQGTPSAAQSVTVNGQGLTADIVATAPAGFEVSSDGVTYGATANIVPVSGSVNTASLFVRIAASASPGSPAGSVSLTSTGSQSVSVAVSGTVTASGQTFANWSGGLSNTPTLQLQYAIGGATSPTATNGVPSVTTVTSNTLSITAVVRTNDPSLTVTGQTLVNLAAGTWTTNEVIVTPQPDPAPEGCQVQTFSTPRGADGKKFLRLQTTLPGTQP